MEAVGFRLESVRTFSPSNSVDWRDGARVCSPRNNHPGAPIDVQIEGSGKNYIDLNNPKLEVKVKLTTPTGGDIGGTTNVSTGNLPLHSLLQSVTMNIADKVVTEGNNIYPYRALLETLINYEAEVMKTRLKF